MSRPKIFQVKFNNPNGVFHNGQNMKGTIIVENQEEIDMEGGIFSFQRFPTEIGFFKLVNFRSGRKN